MSTKILVTTPNGKVGAEVARQLIEKGIPVRIAAHTVEKAKQAFPKAEVVAFDITDEAKVKQAIAGVTAIYLATPGDFASAEPEKRLIDLAKQAGVKRIVKLSVKGIEYADEAPIRKVEKHLEKSGLEYTLIRPTWFMQNYSTNQAQGISQGTLAEPAADAKTAFIDARDIAAVSVAALTGNGHNGKAYAITGSESLSRSDLAAIFTRVLGKPVKYAALTDEQFRTNMKPYLPAHYVDLLSSLYGIVRSGGTADTTNTVRELLGRDPIRFEQFVKDHRGVFA